MKKYDLIYCDPPWSYYGDNSGTNIASRHYNLLPQDTLKALPIKSLLKKPGMLLLWATGPKLHYAIELIQTWGLSYRGVAFVWVKTRKDGKIIFGQGVSPTFTKPTTEFVLLASTTKSGRPIKLKSFNSPQVVLSPRGKHSEKPEKVRHLIEEILKEPYSKLEMFGRRPVKGWDVIGNEVTGEDIFSSIKRLLS